MNWHPLVIGRAIVTTRVERFRLGEELHPFTGLSHGLTTLQGVEEYELRLTWNGRQWTLRPWQSSDAQPRR